MTEGGANTKGADNTSGVSHDGRRWSNAESDRIVVEDYDPNWPEQFAEEAAALDSSDLASPLSNPCWIITGG